MAAPNPEPPRLPSTPRTGLARFRSHPGRPAAAPLALLLLALSTVFLFGGDRGRFYRSGLHGIVTANHLTVAGNLSPRHGFLGFYSLTLDDDGALTYDAYNRFPIGGIVLLKLAMLPFGDDFPAQIHAARTSMLAFFVLAAVLAYLALRRIVVSRWAALAAALAAFSSFYPLYYGDMVAPEQAPSVFGVMLTFHGMVVFVQEGRFRQLLVKACAALLLGWHVYALLLPFIVLGLAREVVGALPRRGARPVESGAGGGPKLGRYLTLGVVTLLFGGALLSFNLGNEYFALGGKVPFTETPTVGSMLGRIGAQDAFNLVHAERLAWAPFLEGQFRRLGSMMLPYGLIEPTWAAVARQPGAMGSWASSMSTWGIVGFGVCLIGLPFVRHRLPMAALALSGFCWALPMRHQTAFHEYDAVFYVGIPLTAFSIVFLCIRKLAGDRFAPVLAAAALPVFVLSGVEMARVGHGGREAVLQGELMQDFEAIRDVVGEGVVYVPAGQRDEVTHERLRYFLAGSVILLPKQSRQREKAGFTILRHRDEGPALLTPDNRRMFLYDRALYDASYEEQALGSPIIASDWNVYRKDGRLIYVSEDCANRKAPFFLSPTPREADDPTVREELRAFDGAEFHWRDIARRADRICAAAIDLPEVDLASVRTGQLHEGGTLWEGEHRFER